MKHGQRLLAVGIFAGTWLCFAWGTVALAQHPSDDPSLQSDYDTPPSEMHPDRWPGPVEPPAKEPTVSPKTETDVLEFLRKHMKYYYDRLMQLKRRDIRAYRRALEYLEGKVKQLRAMPKAIRDAHIRNANVQVEILRAVKGYHQSQTASSVKTFKDKIQKLLSEKFDIEQKVGDYRLKQLDEKLNQRKKKLQDRAKDRKKILAEELRCWLQPPAKAPAETQPTPKPTQSKKTPPPSKPAPKPEKPKKAPSPATQPAKPTTAPTTQPASPKTAPTTKPS